MTCMHHWTTRWSVHFPVGTCMLINNDKIKALLCLQVSFTVTISISELLICEVRSLMSQNMASSNSSKVQVYDNSDWRLAISTDTVFNSHKNLYASITGQSSNEEILTTRNVSGKMWQLCYQLQGYQNPSWDKTTRWMSTLLMLESQIKKKIAIKDIWNHSQFRISSGLVKARYLPGFDAHNYDQLLLTNRILSSRK